jgi:adenylate cyclase
MSGERGSPRTGVREAHEHLHELAYARLGVRYVRLLIVLDAVGLLHLVLLVTAGTWPLYIEMSSSSAIRVVLAVQLLFAAVSVAAWRLAIRLARPIETWIREPDGEGHALAAWRAGVHLPFTFFRSPSILLTALLASACASAYAGVELELAWYEALVLLTGLAIALVTFAIMAFLSFEHGLRTVLEDVARPLPDSLPPGPRLPLQRRLAATLPLITVVTGVIVAGVLPGSGGVGELALAIAVSLGVSLVVSIWLIALLADSVVSPIAALRRAAEQVEQGDLSVRVTPASTDEIGDLGRIFNETVRGLQQRERLREALGAYVDPELANRVQSEGVDLAGEEVVASILFVDLRGFTPLAERTPAREVVALLNDFYDLIIPLLREHGGHPNKLMGDGLLAVFGAPDRRSDHGSRAIQAALAIAAGVRARYGDELRAGIGVDSGAVVVGTIGGGGRLDFTVIGDTVNTAVRVEAATRQTGDDILVTEATLRLAGVPSGSWQERHAVTLKGKQQLVRVFAPPVPPRDAGPVRAARVGPATGGM